MIFWLMVTIYQNSKNWDNLITVIVPNIIGQLGFTMNNALKRCRWDANRVESDETAVRSGDARFAQYLF